MSYINDYFKTTIIFINSLTIKIDEIRKHFNYNFYIKNNIQPPKKSNDKYYLNMAGKLSDIDNKVYVIDPTTQTEVELTYSTLENIPSLKYELLKYDTIFNKLCEQNVGMSTYIRGCINPIDIETSIDADNYTILSYRKDLINENEIGLIVKLNKFIKQYMERYHNRKYMLDELYLPGVLNNLYHALFSYVIILRLKNILTNEVDDFHLQHFLLSYKNLYDYVDIFDKETNIWLYGNLRRLKNNIGKNYILDEILNKVLDKNGYATGKLNLFIDKPEIIENNKFTYDKEYFKYKYKFTVVPASKHIYEILGKDYSFDALEQIQRNCKHIPTITTINKEACEKELSNINRTESLTKTFILDAPEKIKTFGYNTYVSTLSNILYLIKNNKILFNIDYYNSVDSRIYKLNSKDIETILVYNTIKMFDITTPSIELVLQGIYTNRINKQNILTYTWYKDKASTIFDYLINDIGLTTPTTNLTNLQTHLLAIRNIEIKTWYLLSNITDLTAKNDIRVIINNLLTETKVDYNVEALERYISERGLESFFLNHKYMDCNIDLLKTITALSLIPTNDIIDKFRKIIKFFNKTTSYTIQLVMDLNFKEVFINNNTKNSVSLFYKPYMEIKEADYHIYEQADYLIETLGLIDEPLIVTNEKAHVSIRNTPIGILPCKAIKNDIYKEQLILGSRKIRPKEYSTEVSNGILYSNNEININNSYDSSVIDINKIPYLKPYMVSDEQIEEMDKNLALSLPYKTYMYNYNTRPGYITNVNNAYENIYNYDNNIIDFISNTRNSIINTKQDNVYLNIPTYKTYGYPSLYNTSYYNAIKYDENDIDIEITAMPINEKIYKNDQVASELEDIDIDLTFEIKNK